MKAPDFSFLTNKSFKKKFNHEREPEEQGIPILDIYRGPIFKAKKNIRKKDFIRTPAL
jgi:hypothetical protein